MILSQTPNRRFRHRGSTARRLSRKAYLEVESLEGRQLLSHSAAHMPAVPAELAALHQTAFFGGRIKVSDPGEQAILSALTGGAGSEFVQLLRREVHNTTAVIASFVTGARTEFTVPGFAARIPKSQPLYTGHAFDQLNGTVAGALLRPDGSFEFAAIMRGPIQQNLVPSYFLWGVDRGGPANANTSPGLPGVKYDSEVIVAVTPSGTTAAVNDLQTNTSSPIDSSQIKVAGPTIRVVVPASLLPSAGLAPKQYRFGFWTSVNPSGGISSIESFVPDTSSIPIGVQPGRAPRVRHHK